MIYIIKLNPLVSKDLSVEFEFESNSYNFTKFEIEDGIIYYTYQSQRLTVYQNSIWDIPFLRTIKCDNVPKELAEWLYANSVQYDIETFMGKEYRGRDVIHSPEEDVWYIEPIESNGILFEDGIMFRANGTIEYRLSGNNVVAYNNGWDEAYRAFEFKTDYPSADLLDSIKSYFTESWIDPVYERKTSDKLDVVDINRIVNDIAYVGGDPLKMLYWGNDIIIQDEWEYIVEFLQDYRPSITYGTDWRNVNLIEKTIDDIHKGLFTFTWAKCYASYDWITEQTAETKEIRYRASDNVMVVPAYLPLRQMLSARDGNGLIDISEAETITASSLSVFNNLVYDNIDSKYIVPISQDNADSVIIVTQKTSATIKGRRVRVVKRSDDIVRGDFIENVTSQNPHAYPDNGIKDGYWYIKQ